MIGCPVPHRTGQNVIFCTVNWEGKNGRKEARSYGMVRGRVAKVCCSIVAGVRRKQTFLGVVDLWGAGAERRLDLVTGSGTCAVLSPIQKDGPRVHLHSSFHVVSLAVAPCMTVKFHAVHM